MDQQQPEDDLPEGDVQEDDLAFEDAYRAATLLYCNAFHDAHHLLDMQRDELIATHCLAHYKGSKDKLSVTPPLLAAALSESAQQWFAHMQQGIALRHREVVALRDPLPYVVDPTLPYPMVVETVAAAIYEDLYEIDQAENFDPMEIFCANAEQAHMPQDFALMQALAVQLRDSQRDLLRDVRQYLTLQTAVDPDDPLVQREDNDEVGHQLQHAFNLACQPLHAAPTGHSEDLVNSGFYQASLTYINNKVAEMFNSVLAGNGNEPCELTGSILAQSGFMASVMEPEDVAQFETLPAVTPMAKRLRGLQGAVQTLGFLVQADVLEEQLVGFYQGLKGKPVKRMPKEYTATTAFLSAALYEGAAVLAAEADRHDKGYRYAAAHKPASVEAYQVMSTHYYLN